MARAGVGRRASGSVTWAAGRPRVRVPLGAGAEGARDAVGEFGARDAMAEIDGERIWTNYENSLLKPVFKGIYTEPPIANSLVYILVNNGIKRIILLLPFVKYI